MRRRGRTATAPFALFALLAGAWGLSLAGAGRASAETTAPSLVPSAQEEAAERFDHAMALIEQGSDAEALAELTRVYALAPHPRVLFNLGLVHVALNRPVDAVKAFDEVLAIPHALPPAAQERAMRLREEQSRRIAHLDLSTNVPATIELDGAPLGQTPLPKATAVVAGPHILTARSPGRVSLRREILLAGQTSTHLQWVLAPLEEDRERERESEARRIPTPRPQMPLLAFPRLTVPGPSADDQRRPRTHRIWAWAAVASGAVVAGGAGTFLALNASAIANARANLDGVRRIEPCRAAFARDAFNEMCDSALAAADSQVNRAQTKQTVGWVVLGSGVAVGAAGALLLLTRSQNEATSEAISSGASPSRLAAGLGAWVTNTGGGWQLTGRF